MRKSRSTIQLSRPFAAFNAAKAWVPMCLSCYCLTTFFFLITWQSPRPYEPYLISRLRMDGFPSSTQSIADPQAPILSVHLSQSFGTTMYSFQNKSTTMELFTKELANHQSECNTLRVRVSYDEDVPWQSYIFVINECDQQRIHHVEMVTREPLVMVSP